MSLRTSSPYRRSDKYKTAGQDWSVTAAQRLIPPDQHSQSDEQQEEIREHDASGIEVLMYMNSLRTVAFDRARCDDSDKNSERTETEMTPR